MTFQSHSTSGSRPPVNCINGINGLIIENRGIEGSFVYFWPVLGASGPIVKTLCPLMFSITYGQPASC